MTPAAAPEQQPAAQAAPPDFAALYGPNGERLPEELKTALSELGKKYEEYNRSARFEEIRRVQRRHENFKGNQNIAWDATNRRWFPISSTGGVSTKQDDDIEQSRFDYITNIYGRNCLVHVAIMTQNPPAFDFMPRDPRSDSDMATARAAEDVATFITDNNRLDLKQVDLAWLDYNDGRYLSYTRFEVNGQKYGFTQKPIMQRQPRQLTSDTAACANCGNEQETNQQTPPPEACPGCAQPMGPSSVRPGLSGIVPKITGVQNIPNGQEVIDYFGALETEVPFFARSLSEYPWLKLEVEVPKAKMKALFPNLASKLSATSDTMGGDSASQVARLARLSLASTSYGRGLQQGTTSSLLTFKRFWFRNWAFYELDQDSTVQQLLQAFPDGAYYGSCEGEYCESRPENMDEFWAVGHGMPGDGQIRECLGEWTVDAQARFNTEENIKTETFERTLSNRYYDSDMVDLDALKNAAGAGVEMGVTARPGQPIADLFYETPPGAVSTQMVAHSEWLMGEVMQQLTFNEPSVFGGSTGSNDTARGIQLVKDAALGVKALFKTPLNEFHAQTMLNALNCFKKNRKDDVALAVTGSDGKLDARIISMDDLKGNLRVRTDLVNSYPMTLSQKREIVTSILNNPQLASALGLYTPSGISMVRDIMGTTDFEPPGEDARIRQMREIREMMQGVAVQVNPLMDDHDGHIKAASEWWESDEGQKAQVANPQGCALVQQHQTDHLNAKAQQQMAAQAAAQPQPQAQPAQAAQPQGQ